MTFRRQVGRTLGLAAVALGAGFALGWITPILKREGLATGQAVAGNVGDAMMMLGAVLLVMGVVVRSAQRAFWLGMMRPEAKAGGSVADVFLHGWAAPFWGLWLWITPTGEDRDG